MDLVSVIIPTYNNPKELIRTLNSVVNQSYPYIETIVVDDGSNVSYEIIHDFIKQNKKANIIYYKKNNEGPGLARQFGLEKANGKYIQYLDSDDELLPEKLSKQVEILDNNPNYVMTYCLSMINNNKELIHRKKIRREVNDDLLTATLQIRKWHTSSCLWNYQKRNNVWSNLKNGEDVLHDFNIAMDCGQKIYFHDEILSNVNFDDSGNHLSNSFLNSKNFLKLKSDSVKLNLEMYNSLRGKNLLVDPYKEPLSERLFHSSIKLYIMGFNDDGNELLKISKKCTSSKTKFFEIFLVNILKRTPSKYKRKIFQKFYLLHRKINKPSVHQFRFV